MKRRKLDEAKLARSLGSVARGRVSAKPGYLGALQLAAEVRRRFQAPAGGGRATDPGWNSKRLIAMRPDTLARLQQLAKEVSRYARSRVEPLQLAALIIECHLAPAKASQGSLLDDVRQTRRDPGVARGRISTLDLVRDLAGSVAGAPELSAGLRGRAGRFYGAPRKQKSSRRGPGSRQTRSSAKAFPDRSAFRRSRPVLDPPLSTTIIQGRKDRS